MNIAITGAAGKLAGLIIKKLKEKHADAGLVGLAQASSEVSELGISVREADHSKLEALAEALQGVDTLMLSSSSEVLVRAVQNQNIIDAAKTAGVRRIVYTSLLHADVSPLSVASEHFDTEVRIKVSGMAFTILRNGLYSENYAGLAQRAVEYGALVGTAGEARVAAASRNDFAEAAAVVLTSLGHAGRTYELAGDTHYTISDLAAEISRHSGRDIPYRHLSVREHAAALRAMGVNPQLAQHYVDFDVAASNGAFFDTTKKLSTLIGRPTTPLTDIVADALAPKFTGPA